MEIDHLFIVSVDQGREADELVRFGLIEGSNRVHPGQGTRNRKFYFDNFFLEIIWVSNEQELRSKRVAPTRLWERANYPAHNTSPFGLCLAHTPDTDTLFRDSIPYQPVYIPAGTAFDILPHEAQPCLPWTCRLPLTDQQQESNEPTDHPAGIRRLTNIRFGIPAPGYRSRFTDFMETHSQVRFEPANRHHLTLEFDAQRQGHTRTCRGLPLTIAY